MLFKIHGHMISINVSYYFSYLFIYFALILVLFLFTTSSLIYICFNNMTSFSILQSLEGTCFNCF